MTNYTTKDYDAIYLQTCEFPETTWCVDQINDDDIEYLRATPEREAADEMYEALKPIARAKPLSYKTNTYDNKKDLLLIRLRRYQLDDILAAIALAKDEKGGE